ncbi:MAG: T9SS type A sorting domain-containing protein, partial [Methanothrix sp.]|nr:T9SS type A sorting domain-containing protein [Methanothrix sp.]
VSGSTVYTGGYFRSIGDSTRNWLAALDASTGKATGWNPDPVFSGDYFYALVVSGSTVYAAGEFDTIGDSARTTLAAIDASTGTATSWDPKPDNLVRAIAVSGSTVYVGGDFANIGDSLRDCLAALDASTGKATSWNPDADGGVRALALNGSRVYAGGYFTMIGDSARNFLAAIDLSTGNAAGWRSNADSYVRAIAASGSIVYVGGEFTGIGSQARNGIAAIDASTGTPTNWDPNANGSFSAIALDFTNVRVYAGGNFTTVLDDSRGGFVGLTNPDDPALPVQLFALAAKVSGNTVQLAWNTAGEVNSHGFEVQRKTILNSGFKTQNAEWMKLAFVPGAGTSSRSNSYTFTDPDVSQGRYDYRLKQIDRDGSFKYSVSTEVTVGSIPLEFSLAQNYPNPFNPSTTIRYGLPSPSRVRLLIHDLLGREIKTLVDDEQIAGWQEVRWDASGIASGVYFYTLRAGNFVQTKKLVVMK